MMSKKIHITSLNILFLSLFIQTHAQYLVAFENDANKCGFKDSIGNILVEAKYDYCSLNYEEDQSIVVLNQKYGIVNIKGKEIVPLIYDSISFIGHGLIKSILDDKWSFIDLNTGIISPKKYDYIDAYSDGFISVYLNEKCGFINLKGQEITPIIYDEVWGFKNGRARVTSNGRTFFIDSNGEEIQ